MTADSNYEIKKDGAQVLLSLAGQSCHPGRFIESVVLSGSKEKNREIKSLTNKAVIRLGENYGPEVVVTELARLLPKSAMSSQQTEEISNLLTILLLKTPSNDLAVEICPLLPLIFNDYAQKTVQAGVELASLIGSIVTTGVDPLLTALDAIDRPEGSVYLKQSVLGRIRNNKMPSLDQNCLLVMGDAPKMSVTPRKGSAGRARSKFFPNGWTNQEPASGSLPLAASMAPAPSASPISQNEPENEKSQNDFLSSSLPSSFFKKKSEKSKETILRKPSIPKSASRANTKSMLLPPKESISIIFSF